MKYTEARRLRPLPPKRFRDFEALVDFESDIETDGAETTLDDSMSQSLLDESLGTRGESYWKQRCLMAEEALKAEKAKHQAEVSQLKAKYEADVGASRDLFRVRTKPTRENGSGSTTYYGKELKAIAIDAAGQGVASRDIQRVMKSIHRFINFEGQEGERKVPEVDYLNKLRAGELAQLVDNQRQQWVESAEKIVLSVDKTSMNGKGYLALGGFNEQSQYHCLAIKEIGPNTGKEYASVMLKMIEQIPGLKDKLCIFISDRDRAQENAIKQLLEILNKDRPADQQIIHIVCLMHTTIRMDDRSFDKLSKEAKEVSSLVAQAFGSRKSLEFRKACLKQPLTEKLQGRAGFDTKIGSRFHVNKANGENLIHFEEEIVDVLVNHGKHPKHTALLGYMRSNQWPKLRFELCVPVIIWVNVIGPFHSTASMTTSYGAIKDAFHKAMSAVNDVLNSVNAFTVALTMALESNPTNLVTKAALNVVARQWRSAGVVVKKEVANVTRAAFTEAKRKLESDWNVMGSISVDDDCVMQWSQRRIESTFAFLKCCARRFETMRDENVSMLARARQNHTSTWVAWNLDLISDASTKEAYYERMEKYEHDFTLEQAIESFTDAI